MKKIDKSTIHKFYIIFTISEEIFTILVKTPLIFHNFTGTRPIHNPKKKIAAVEIIKTNILTKFDEDMSINMASRVRTTN